MALLALLELVFIILLVWGVLTQIVVPTFAGVPRFPFFRRHKQQKLLTDIAEAEARRYELNLEAIRLKQEGELALAEAFNETTAKKAAMRAAQSEGEKK